MDLEPESARWLGEEEALRGDGRSGIRASQTAIRGALGRLDRPGTLEIGKAADMVWWDIGHPAELAYEVGVDRLRQRVVRGEVADGSRA